MLAFKTSVQTSNNILIYFYLFLLAGDCSYIHACDAETDIIYFHSSGDYWAIPSQFPWGRDISTMPVFTIKEIEQFFESSGKTKNTRKRANTLLFDNFLDSLQCSKSNNYFYIRAVCSASYRKNTFQKLSCAISCGNTTTVCHAFCTCVAGKGGQCNHVYALLKQIAQFSLDKVVTIPETLPCTSRPCGWTVPQLRKTDVRKPSVLETVVKKPKIGKQPSSGVTCTLYEARAPVAQAYPYHAITEMNDKLQEINPFIPIVDDIRKSTSDDDWVESKFGKVPIYSPMAYQCSKLGNNYKAYFNISSLTPNSKSTCATYPDFPHRKIPVYFTPTTTLSQPEINLLKNIMLTEEEATSLEQATRDQAASGLWHNQRKCRLTASRVSEVFQWKRGLESHATKFVSSFGTLNTQNNPVLQRKLSHGKMYEAVAWQKYKECMQSTSCDVQVLPSGLVINSNNCWLGCSPDARVICGDLFGIGESKCPEQYKHCDVFDIAKSSDAFLLLVNNENKLVARKTHSAYYQIQCQLALTGSQFCDLVVYTFVSIGIVRVRFDVQFWDEILKKVGHNYFTYILPKLAL